MFIRGPIAQLVEQLAFNQWVAGSSPARLTTTIKTRQVPPDEYSHSEGEYQQLVELLDSLTEVGEDESHPLASFMEVVGNLIEVSTQSSDRRTPSVCQDTSVRREL